MSTLAQRSAEAKARRDLAEAEAKARREAVAAEYQQKQNKATESRARKIRQKSTAASRFLSTSQPLVEKINEIQNSINSSGYASPDPENNSTRYVTTGNQPTIEIQPTTEEKTQGNTHLNANVWDQNAIYERASSRKLWKSSELMKNKLTKISNENEKIRREVKETLNEHFSEDEKSLICELCSEDRLIDAKRIKQDGGSRKKKNTKKNKSRKNKQQRKTRKH
jgi:hypothetical protein